MIKQLPDLHMCFVSPYRRYPSLLVTRVAEGYWGSMLASRFGACSPQETILSSCTYHQFSRRAETRTTGDSGVNVEHLFWHVARRTSFVIVGVMQWRQAGTTVRQGENLE